jgi:uncharacterized repeat protein (TIGR01451 family)
LSGAPCIERDRRPRGSLSRTTRALWVGSLLGIAAVLVLSLIPPSEGKVQLPPDIVATLVGVQLDDRISYTLLMKNQGGSDALDISITAPLPAGLVLEGGGSVWSGALATLGTQVPVQFRFVAVLDPRVPGGTVEAVTAYVTYRSQQGPDTLYETVARSEVTIARGLPPAVWLAAAAAGVLVILGYAWKIRADGVRINQLFLLHDSGMLIRHYSSGQGVQRDSDIMSGMLIVLQEFVRDSFNDRRSSLEEVRFGDQRVVMARGEHAIMAAVVTGKRLNGLSARLQRAVGEFEGVHRETLSRWNGDLATLDSAEAALRSVLPARHRGAPTT